MKFIEVAGKKFKLASRLTRLYAFFIDVALIGVAQSVLGMLLSIVVVFLGIGSFGLPELLLGIGGLSIFTLLFSVALWIFGLFFIDGFRKGQQE